MRTFEHRRASEFRHQAFWALLDERHPQERHRRVQKMRYFWQRGLPEKNLVITLYVSPDKDRCGVFLGRNEKLGAVNVADRLRPIASRIFETLRFDPKHSSPAFPFVSQWQVNCYSEDNWPAMVDWMVTEASRLEAVVTTLLDAEA